MWACRGNHWECARLLAEAGANVSKGDYNGYLPICFACKDENKEAVRMLLENGAKACSKDKRSHWGHIPLCKRVKSEMPKKGGKDKKVLCFFIFFRVPQFIN